MAKSQGAKSRSLSQLRRLQSADERFLHHVLGILALTEHAVAEGEDLTLKPCNQRTGRLVISGKAATNQIRDFSSQRITVSGHGNWPSLGDTPLDPSGFQRGKRTGRRAFGKIRGRRLYRGSLLNVTAGAEILPLFVNLPPNFP